MTKPIGALAPNHREDVLKVAGEPAAWAATSEEGKVEALGFNQSRRFDTTLYTEAQALAMYAAGEEAAAYEIKALKYSLQLDEELIGMIQKIITVLNNRPAPITTNTEGEQR